MNDFLSEIMLQIQQYNNKPIYSLQVNKNGCRMLVETNAMPPGILGNFYTDKGESMMISLNQYILKTGKQNIKIKIYPRQGEEFINSYAHLDIKLYYNSNKDSGLNNFQCLEKIFLPDDIAERKLQYFEINIPFDASVPYDFSNRIETSIDLKTVSNIEKMILEKFEKKRKILKEGNEVEYNKDEKDGYIMAGNTSYATKEELFEYYHACSDAFNLSFKDRIVSPIEDYEIIFYKNNKLVTIINKNNKFEILKIGFTYQDKPAIALLPLVLYMPKGSSELKVW